jgi:hypothetical protein
MADCGKGWGARCSSSQGERCRCSCGGEHHGAYWRKKRQERVKQEPPAVVGEMGVPQLTLALSEA